MATDFVGVIAVAPLVIGLIGMAQERPPRTELVEGTITLMVLTAMTAFIILVPAVPWQTAVPVALLFPMLLWLAARCRPVFAAAGAFIVSLAIVWASHKGIGHFGDPSVAAGDRILEAQAGILIVSLGALVLAALLAERKDNEAHLARTVTMLERERNNKMLTIRAATSSIVHEVRQPLAAIITNSAAARRWLQRAPPDVCKAARLLGEIEKGTLRANDVLENVRKLFQDADHNPEPIDVNKLVIGGLKILRGELSDHGIETQTDLGTGLKPVMGHGGQLQEVILNLVQNAIDAMASVESRRRALRVRTRPDGAKAIVIEVEDSGQGIEPDRLDRIFEAFVTTKPRGTGLGLAICSRIIERHGGQLTASSDGKSGALFRIALPVAFAMAGAE
jgi:signal transduction histidine kinase